MRIESIFGAIQLLNPIAAVDECARNNRSVAALDGRPWITRNKKVRLRGAAEIKRCVMQSHGIFNVLWREQGCGLALGGRI